MQYRAYQAHADLLAAARLAADVAGMSLALTPPWFRQTPGVAQVRAGWEMLSRAGLTHRRPDYGFTTIRVDGEDRPVIEEVVLSAPFGDLVRFAKAGAPEQPRVLVVAPLSGHFATLLRGTIETLLPDNDVYITDWKNARDVPLSSGVFGFDDYVAYVIDFLAAMGPGGHLLAVCQPCAHALAAVALMAEDDHPATPASMTLMAGPVDTRINPTRVNELAAARPLEWFERELIAITPDRYAGAGRKVYPGFIQLSAFMLMNLHRHVSGHVDMYSHLAASREAEAESAKVFYDEYFAVLDLTAEFYLETVGRIFQQNQLAKGELTVRNRLVNPAAIRKTALFTVEGERDDICAVGQTVAAHDLCSGIYANRKRHHMQPGVGHYGVFSGRKWQNQVYPLVRNMILATS
ncbi:polyhydroxyalkanoate depolymerase [Phenylobacterium immobile]|uniref:polyhydroxyalkanoate depolymerase n=1 Tax=Phenylobacterium immobile TaxID=21 RepID=UPI000B057A92|nr:polyhydroxyalkanoate depolymerase [Phenylobacterium immobile]